MADSTVNALQDRAIALIKPLMPSDAADRVGQAVQRSRRIVRDHLGDETGLSLLGRSIPIQIVDGFPVQIARLIDTHEDAILWLLVMLRPKLAGVVEGLTGLLEHWQAFESWPSLPNVAKGTATALDRSLEVAIALQTLPAARRVFEEIKEINEDILGTYYFANGGSHIEIYWMAQALFAAVSGGFASCLKFALAPDVVTQRGLTLSARSVGAGARVGDVRGQVPLRVAVAVGRRASPARCRR